MKRILLCIIAGALMASMITSCAATKRDCNGMKKYRLKNGIYI